MSRSTNRTVIAAGVLFIVAVVVMLILAYRSGTEKADAWGTCIRTHPATYCNRVYPLN